MKKKFFMLLNVYFLLLLTGCNEDMFNTGVVNTNYTAPYANKQGYLLVNYDLKEVEPREDNLLNEFDFSGPMNSYFETNNTHASSVITTPAQVMGTTTLEGEPESDLNYCAASGYVSPIELDDSGSIGITSSFGPRWGSVHQGLDIGCPVGTKIYAINAGTVSSAGYSNSMGNYVIVAHENDLLGNISSVYMHNSELIVKTGDKVEKGQLLSLAGSTGNSTGSHLHIGIKDSSGTYVDPEPLLNLENFPDYRQ